MNKNFDILEQSSFQKYTTCWVFLALRHMLYLCICVFVFVYLCMRHLVISVYGALSYLISLSHNLFKNIPHVGSFWHCGLCCICVFVYETLGNISFDILGPRAFRKYMVCMV